MQNKNLVVNATSQFWYLYPSHFGFECQPLFWEYDESESHLFLIYQGFAPCKI